MLLIFRVFSVASQCAGDHDLLDLAGPFIYPGYREGPETRTAVYRIGHSPLSLRTSR